MNKTAIQEALKKSRERTRKLEAQLREVEKQEAKAGAQKLAEAVAKSGVDVSSIDPAKLIAFLTQSAPKSSTGNSTEGTPE